LRFASDEELPSLVEKIISGEVKTSKEIKMAIKNWRGDYLRV
jgi:predicted transcriptional regulator